MGVEGTETRIASCGDVLLGRVVRVCGGGVVALISLLVGPFLVARRRQIDTQDGEGVVHNASLFLREMISCARVMRLIVDC